MKTCDMRTHCCGPTQNLEVRCPGTKDFLTSAFVYLYWYQVCRKEAEALPAMTLCLATVLEMYVAGAGLRVAPSALGQLLAQPQAPEQRRCNLSLTSHLLC